MCDRPLAAPPSPRLARALRRPALPGIALALVLVSSGESSADGALTQLAPPGACVSETGAGDCEDGKGLADAFSVAVTGDGKHVYVASKLSAAVAAFRRDKTTGALSQLAGVAACVNELGSSGCANGKTLLGASSVAVSADGKHVYVASFDADGVAAFTRDKVTGALGQLAGTEGCVSEDGRDFPGGTAGVCTNGKALLRPHAIAVARDGKHVYVASSLSNAIAVFTRNKATGVLTLPADPEGCVSETGTGGECTSGKALLDPRGIAVTPDGKHVYVASSGSSAVAAFSRNKTTGALTQLADPDACVSEDGTGGECANGKALAGAWAVAVSLDGKNVYVAAGNGVAVFARDKATGALAQLADPDGCVSQDDTGGACAIGKALTGIEHGIAVTRYNIYVASRGSNAVAAFARDRTNGALTQLPDPAGCVNEDGSGGCTAGTLVVGAVAATASKDGKHVYVASMDGDGIAAFSRD